MKEEDTDSGGEIPRKTFQNGRIYVKKSLNSPLFGKNSYPYRRLYVSISLVSVLALFMIKECLAYPIFPESYISYYYHHHQQPSSTVFYNLHPDSLPSSSSSSSISHRSSHLKKRDLKNESDNKIFRNASQSIEFIGFRIIGDEHTVTNDQISYYVKESEAFLLKLFAKKLDESVELWIGLSPTEPEGEERCAVRPSSVSKATLDADHSLTATPSLAYDPDGSPFYLCYSFEDPKQRTTPYSRYTYVFNDSSAWNRIYVKSKGLPIYIQISFILLLLSLSGLFSGLNLGLMALDLNELQVIQRCGTADEKNWASTIVPVRQKGNLLLCTLLLGNVLVNSTLTIFLDQLTSGFFAVMISTLMIVIFGEIVPQALCSRHGLSVGARTIYITYLFMALTYPLSYPISLFLDKLLGEEIGNVYNRERLMEYIRVTKDHNNFEPDEMNLISGALKFKNIKVVDVMTPLSDVFMLPYNSVLDFETMAKINNSGYSRIPIYEGDISNVVAMLHVKDLALIDAKQELKLETVLKFYQHPLISVFEDVTLQYMLAEFKKGKSHMALCRRVVDNGINDPTYELLGVVTLEDVIEELIQAEINDETDIVTDNRRKQKRFNTIRQNNLDFIRFNAQVEDDHVKVLAPSPQILLATYQFLISTVEPFRPEHVSEEVLKLLLKKDIYFRADGEPPQTNLENLRQENVLYRAGVPSNDFIMILEGRARVVCTNEQQEYEAGPFCFFGKTCLMGNISEKRNKRKNSVDELSDSQERKPFIPDFTVYCTERVIYMRITLDKYNHAINQSALQINNNNKLIEGLPDSPVLSDPSISVIQPPITAPKTNESPLPHTKQTTLPTGSNVNNNNVLGQQTLIKNNSFEFEMNDLNGGKQTPTNENSKLI